jgi:hypothetical protein
MRLRDGSSDPINASMAGLTCSVVTGRKGKPTAPPALDTSRQQVSNWACMTSSTIDVAVNQRNRNDADI